MKARETNLLSLGSFSERHPFAATSLVCLFALFFGQTQQISRSGFAGQSGEYNFVMQVPAIALSALLLLVFADFVLQSKAKPYTRAIYVGAGCGVVYLCWLALAHTGETARRLFFALLAAALFALFAFLLAKKRKPSGVLAAAVCLAVCAASGAGFAFALTAAALCVVLIFADAGESGAGILAGGGESGMPACADGGENRAETFAAAGTVCVTALAAFLSALLISDPQKRLLFAGFVLCFGLYFASSLRKKATVPPLIVLLFSLGLLLRLGYVLDVPLPRNQHDVFSIFNRDYHRHNDYIMYIYNNRALPKDHIFNAGLSQYYHPPLHHLLAALWMKFQTLCGFSLCSAYENVQYLTMTYSALAMTAGFGLLREFRLRGAALYAAAAVIAFHPTFFILAGSVNNDPLVVLLLFLAMLYTVRWYRDRSVKNTLLLALSIGLAVMTKLSGAVIAFGTAFVFLAALLDKKTGGFAKNLKALWSRFLLFAAVCCPLGLWWPLRCHAKFGMPLTYVPSLSESSAQFVGNRTVWQRLTGIGSYSLGNPFPNLGGTTVSGGAPASGQGFYDYGIAPYALKSSLFGEYFSNRTVSSFQKALAYVLTFSALALTVLGIVGLVAGLVSVFGKRGGKGGAGKRGGKNGAISAENRVPFLFLAVYSAFLVGSYTVFCFRYPFTCTMDFRYIVPTVLVGAVWAGLAASGGSGRAKWARYALSAFAFLFCLASVGFYLASYVG